MTSSLELKIFDHADLTLEAKSIQTPKNKLIFIILLYKKRSFLFKNIKISLFHADLTLKANSQKDSCNLATQKPSEKIPAEPSLIYGGEAEEIFLQTKLIPSTKIDIAFHE